MNKFRKIRVKGKSWVLKLNTSFSFSRITKDNIIRIFVVHRWVIGSEDVHVDKKDNLLKRSAVIRVSELSW